MRVEHGPRWVAVVACVAAALSLSPGRLRAQPEQPQPEQPQPEQPQPEQPQPEQPQPEQPQPELPQPEQPQPEQLPQTEPEPEQPQPHAEPQSQADPQPQAEPQPQLEVASSRVENPEPARARSDLRLGAGLAFGVLNLPKVGVGATLLAQVRLGEFWPLELSAVYWFENEDELNFRELDLRVNPFIVVPFPSGGSRSAFRAAELKAALCPFQHPLASGTLLGCAGVAGGALFARSEGLVASDEQTRPLFGFEAYVRWRFPLAARVELTYSVGLFAALIRERFGYRSSLDGFREQFQIAPLGGRLDAALGYAF